MSTNIIVVGGDASSTGYEINGLVEKGLQSWDQGDFGTALNAFGTVVSAFGTYINNANLASWGSVLGAAGAFTSLDAAVTQFRTAETEEQQVDAALGAVGAFGNFIAVVGVAPNVKALGVALSASANAARGLLKNRQAISTAFSEWFTGGLKFGEIFPGPTPRGLIDPRCNIQFQSSRSFVQRVDPLTLDLNGDGLSTTGIDPNHPILFDHDGDGIKTATGWVKPDDGFLVLDRNGNGVIDSGRELFGDSTALYAGGTAADGFAALAQEDTNSDGLVNASDAHWNQLRLWRDLNQDGISQSNELLTLQSQNIAALKVGKSANNQTLANGNQIADLGGYIKTDGSEGALGEVVGMGDINLASNPFYSQFPDTLPLTQAAQGITDMHGAGMVRSLREAASLDGNIATQVAALNAPMTRAQMMAQVDSIIGGWAATSGMQTSVQQAAAKGYTLKYIPPGATATDILAIFGMDGGGGSGGEGNVLSAAERQRRANLKAQTEHINRLVATLERFNGVPFVNVGDNSITTGAGRTIKECTTDPNPSTGETSRYVFMGFTAGQFALLEQSYTQLQQSVYDGLVLEGRLKHYLEGIELSITGQGVSMDFGGMEAANDSEWRIEA